MAGHLARQQAASWPLHQQYEGKIHRMAQSGVREAFHELQEIPTYRGTSKAKSISSTEKRGAGDRISDT
ncbi:unnamed protein product, partial [Clonostachys rosea f. rosea IK726]